MKIRTLFKTLFCAGLVLSLALYLLYLHGNHIEKTQKPIVDYQYNGYEEKPNYKRSNTILITYKSRDKTNPAQKSVLNNILIFILFPIQI